jgi:aldose 1-epimerase
VSTAGGAVLEAEASGIPLLSPSRTPGLATRIHGGEACFPLVPFGGRIENNAFCFGDACYGLTPNTDDPLVLHGDGWLREWSVAGVGKMHVDLQLNVEKSDHSPFAYLAEQRIEVLPGGLGLGLRLSVENRGSRALPFGLGFHPYLPVTPVSMLAFGAKAVWTERDMHLPGERRDLNAPFDFDRPAAIPSVWINNCYDGWQGQATITQPGRPGLLMTADPIFDRLMVFKPPGPSSFLCLEPMSHRPNAHADPSLDGLVVLEPGNVLAGSMTIALQGA